MLVYAVVFCAGFMHGPMRCAPQPSPSPLTLKACTKLAARRQKATGPAIVKLPNGLVAVRRWECAGGAAAEEGPAG